MAQVSFTVNITINPVAQPLSAINNPLNLTGTVGTAFSQDLSTNLQGGVPPYSLSVQGSLPPGLTQNGTVVSGTPTQAGTTTLNVTATDSAGS